MGEKGLPLEIKMRKNFIIFSILFTGILLLPVFVFGATSYLRTPSGYTISDPISFFVSWENFHDICWQGDNVWGLAYEKKDWTSIYSECISSDINSYTFIENLPLTEYVRVGIVCGVDVCNKNSFSNPLEYIPYFQTIFKIIPPPLLTLPENAISNSVAYIGDLINSISVFIWLFIGVPLGFVVIKKIIKIMPKK